MNKCSVPLSKPTLPCSFLTYYLTMKRLCIRVYPRGLLTCDHDCPCALNFCGITTQVCVEIWPLITCGRSSISRVHTWDQPRTSKKHTLVCLFIKIWHCFLKRVASLSLGLRAQFYSTGLYFCHQKLKPKAPDSMSSVIIVNDASAKNRSRLVDKSVYKAAVTLYIWFVYV